MPIRLWDKLVAAFPGPYADANRVAVEAAGFGNNVPTTTTQVQEIAAILDGLTNHGITRAAASFTSGFTIDNTNLNTYANQNIFYTAATDADVTVNLPSNAVTPANYPFQLTFIHIGGTARSSTTNRLTIVPVGGQTFLLGDQSVSSITLQKGDVVAFEYRASGVQPVAIPIAGLETGQAALPEGTFRFNSRRINATDSESFANSLTGYTPQQGDAFRVSTGGNPFTDATVNVPQGSTVVALKANPTLNDANDWLVISSTTTFSLTAAERAFLSQLTESAVDVIDRVVPHGEVELRFWLRSALVTPANIESPSVGLRLDEANGVVSGTGNIFLGDADSNDTFLYISFDIGTHATLTDDFFASLRIRVRDASTGEAIQLLDFNTSFTRQTDIDNTSYRYYRQTDGGFAGSILQYTAGQFIEAVVVRQDNEFTLDATTVDLTQNVDDLDEDQFDRAALAKLNKDISLDFTDRDRLDQLQAVSQSNTGLALSSNIRIKRGGPSHLLTDYDEVAGSVGLPPSFVTAKTWNMLIPHQFELTAMTGAESGTATFTEIAPSTIAGYRDYSVVVPVGGTVNNIFTPTVTETAISGYSIADEVEVREENFRQPFLDRILANTAGGEVLSDGLRDLNHHITVAGVTGMTWTAASNPTLSDVTFTRRFAAFWDENKRVTANAGNYFTDLTNPTITSTNDKIHFFTDGDDPLNQTFPGKKSYYARGKYDVNGGPLLDDFSKIIAFSARVLSDAADTNHVLLAAGQGTEQRLLRVRNGQLQGRQGNNDGNSVLASERRPLPLADGTGTDGHFAGNASTTLTFSVGADVTIPQSFLIQVEQFTNGSLTSGESYSLNVTNRDADQAGVNNTLFTSVVFTTSYDADADINGVTEDVIRVQIANQSNAAQSYTIRILAMPITIATSSISSFTDIERVPSETEFDVLLMFEKTNGLDNSANPNLTMKLVVNGHSENNVDMFLPDNTFAFNNLVFGDDTVAISEIQVYDFSVTQIFSTPTHADLLRLYNRRSDWLGQFRHPNFASRNYTVDGGLILTDEDNTTFDVIERFKTVSPGPAPEIVDVHKGTSLTDLEPNVTLPADYADSDVLEIVEYVSGTPDEWRTLAVPVDLLSSGFIESDHVIRIQGNTDIGWTLSTRVVRVIGGGSRLWLVRLVKY